MSLDERFCPVPRAGAACHTPRSATRFRRCRDAGLGNAGLCLPTPIRAGTKFAAVTVNSTSPSSRAASGKLSLGRELIAAVRALKQLEPARRPASDAERTLLARFPGFGVLALWLFPDPITANYKDKSWQTLGEELRSLLSPDEYASARRTTFNAFYTPPVVVAAMHEALGRFGVRSDALVLEPGCGIGNFMAAAPKAMRFVGIEMDAVSGRIAQALHPQHDVRIEDFVDTRLRPDSVDAVLGNVPFAKLKLSYAGQRFALHEFFVAKSLAALRPGGILALVTSRFMLDKRNDSVRRHLADRAEFLGAIRLPSNAFGREGTAVVTDIVFLRKQAASGTASSIDKDWLRPEPIVIDGAECMVNGYYLSHPDMVLGSWSRKNRLYGSDGFSVCSQGDLAEGLRAAVERLPTLEPSYAADAVGPCLESSHPVAMAGTCQRTEGGFFVELDGTIAQWQEGQAIAVVQGGKALKAAGSLTGQRLAALIGLRDLARRVLQSQNEGWSFERRATARQALNRAYDAFVRSYGAINKSTLSRTAEGGLVRRMPNLVKFRDDPDAMLVMSLEHYDEEAGMATKAAIMHCDVVGDSPAIATAPSAEAALLVSLDRRGAVDLDFMARLYGRPTAAIVDELGPLVYFDPSLQAWQTADAYLSGNVRRKLAEARQAGPEFARNATALEAVQPDDVLPGDIDAKLGAPWLPVEDVQAFACELFRVAARSVEVAHCGKDAVWFVEADDEAARSVAAVAEFGTARVNGTQLFSLALNMKAPTVYDTLDAGDRQRQVVNQSETVAARAKQRAIKERFRAWVFADAERTERLVRIYNDTYNNLRPRRFDGSHLAFPGMNRTVALNRHQKDAAWRGMCGGNALLAHAVGAGKTYTMAATAMKLKQAGLIRKAMFVVPNHMLEQFAREFLHLYPNARLLVAAKEDLARDRRKLLTAKIASGCWDGIIVTHSSFERIGMSRAFRERFLRRQIADYDRLLKDRATAGCARVRRHLIKSIEKQKAQRAARLKELLAEDKKDDGLVFDELGVDRLFIDEAHCFKNLETPTKMDRVAGIQTSGSERAFDLWMKCRWLDERQPGHGVVFATGTPISNTMVELYTLQRFLDPGGLRQRGIEHFDAWAATFGEVVETMEISPDGASLRPRCRFAKFTNLPELQQMFLSFADVQTAATLQLPTPRIEGGKPRIVACPMSSEQRARQQELVDRYDRLRRDRVDPRQDNALAITTAGRKLALDARLAAAAAKDYPGSKLHALVDNVDAIWRRTAATRGTQMVFCDLGVHPTAWGYSAYDDVVEQLVERGIPRAQIAIVGEADGDAQMQALFERVRQGAVRILLGSTQKMGTGANVQRRLAALHHLDAPWKPAEVEQREGRILRQGNGNAEVAIYRYVTEGSFDAYMWQALETKARFIAQVMSGESGVRSAEDIGGQELSYAEVKAIASGNPAVLTLAEADAELQRLAVLQRHHADEQFRARRNVAALPTTIDELKRRLKGLGDDGATAAAHAGDPVTIDGHACHPDELHRALSERLEAVLGSRGRDQGRHELGTFCGLSLGLAVHGHAAPEVVLEGAVQCRRSLPRHHFGARAVQNMAQMLASGYADATDAVRKELALAEGQLRDYQAGLGAPFEAERCLLELTRLRDELGAALSDDRMASAAAAMASCTAIAAKINALRSQSAVNAVASTPAPTQAPSPRLESTLANQSVSSPPTPPHGRTRRQRAAATPVQPPMFV